MHLKMNKTMNWGTKVVLGLATFMTFIIVLAVIMFNSKTDALVDNDYYEKGINYNQDYNRKEQVKLDRAEPVVVTTPENISIAFKQPAQGSARLMRTADKRMDRVFPFENQEQLQVNIPARGLHTGSWRLIIDWVSNGKSYLYEQEIVIR